MKRPVFHSPILPLTLLFSVILVLFVGSVLIKNKVRTTQGVEKQAAFSRLLDEIFAEELAQSPLVLHYLLKNEAAYGLTCPENPTLGEYSVEQGAERREWLCGKLAALREFDAAQLTREQALLQRSLLWSYEQEYEEAAYRLLSNPLSPVSGVQSSLPLLLSEFRLESREDIEHYLSLLDSVYASFESLITYELARREQGFAPAAVSDERAAGQCASLLNVPLEENPLIASFTERLSAVEFLTEMELATYEMKNRYRVETSVLPAYAMLMEFLSESAAGQTGAVAGQTAELMETEQARENSGNSAILGLCAFPEGKEYYSSLAKRMTSSDLTIPEMTALLERYRKESLLQMKQIAQEYPSVPAAAAAPVYPADSPEEAVAFLSRQTALDFPMSAEQNQLLSGKLQVSLREVPDCFRNLFGPALYLLPPMDDYLNNIVYTNPMYSDGDSFPTLAHETFPGHLYARVCFLSANPHPVRSLCDYIGWEEGWAGYAEQASFAYAQLPGVEEGAGNAGVGAQAAAAGNAGVGAQAAKAGNAGGVAQAAAAGNPGAGSRAEQQALGEFLKASSISLLCLYGLSDLGIHASGWTCDEVARFWADYGVSAESAAELWKLVVSEPGYYLPYSVGVLLMYELEAELKAGLGADFYHRLLTLGPLPYAICREEMQEALLR